MRIVTPFIVFLIINAVSAPCVLAREIVINAVGDIMLAGSGVSTYKKQGYDYPFAATRAELKKGDIAIANLESPITRNGKVFMTKRFHYQSAPQTARALKNAGFSVVTLANNHMMDFGAPALAETRKYLGDAGIACTGGGDTLAAARRPAVMTVNGRKIAFLAYSMTFPDAFYAAVGRPGTAPGVARYVREDIVLARKSADYVVVSFHWGSENMNTPKPYQVAAAHHAIDAGADLVLGNHPHVLQGIEHYKRGVIFYSLGNFAFGTLSRTARRSVIARIFLEGGVKGVELIPLNVLNRDAHYQPKVLTGKEGKEVIDHLARLSGRWNTSITTEGGRYQVRLDNATRLAKR